MATRRYSLNRGDNEYQVTEAVGAAVATKNIELTFDLAVPISREDVLDALDMFRNYIIRGNFPPA